MSFKIQWPTFGSDFIESAIQQLNVALNSGKKPANIVGEIKVIQLFMGSKPPELEILEITELLNERLYLDILGTVPLLVPLSTAPSTNYYHS